MWKLNPETLKPVGMLPSRELAYPRELQEPTMDFTHADGSSVGVGWVGDRGSSTEDGRYVLRWEGDMDIPAYLRALADIGFDGPLALDLYDGNYMELASKSVPILKKMMERL